MVTSSYGSSNDFNNIFGYGIKGSTLVIEDLFIDDWELGFLPNLVDSNGTEVDATNGRSAQ